MKNYFLFIALVCLFPTLVFGAERNIWSPAAPGTFPANAQLQHPKKYIVYQLDETSLKSILYNVSSNPAEPARLSLPQPDGSFREFEVWEQSMMPPALAAKYPEIRTYKGQAVGNATITVKLDFTDFGFHAMIYNGDNTAMIDPYDAFHDGYYMVHYSRDEIRTAGEAPHCETKPGTSGVSKNYGNELISALNERHSADRTVNGYQLRSYRLALSADSWYCQKATGLSAPTMAQCLCAMTTAMNRVNGVYERELSITTIFVAKEDTLIWPTETGSVNGPDPFYSIDVNADACLSENETICDSRIVDSNYDFGHVFTTGAGGLSWPGTACNPGYKAMSVTGQPTPVGDAFTINYVAHEIGHELGAGHSFNNNIDGSCNGNADSILAFEPGSGSTIMAYANICSPDDLQANSDAYFHAINLSEIEAYTTTGLGNACALRTPTLNLPVYIDSFETSYSIPFLTPFELTAPIAKDSITSDTFTSYCWEEWNLGDFGKEFVHAHQSGPLFRSFTPVSYPSTRVFPNSAHVAEGYLNDAGVEENEGEKVPDCARFLTFRLTVRDIYAGNGCFLIPNDTVHLDVINTGEGFTVSSQADTGIVYEGGSIQTITWNLVNTPAAPISTDAVDIYMSVDGGAHWMYHVGTFENTGSAEITVPNPPATITTARFKVKGHNNVFFNVNRQNFTVTNNPHDSISAYVAGTKPNTTTLSVFPVPASGILHIQTGIASTTDIAIFNATGQEVWQGAVNSRKEISVTNWAKGVYYLIARSGKALLPAKKIIVE